MSCPSQLLTIAGTITLATRIPSGLAKIKKNIDVDVFQTKYHNKGNAKRGVSPRLKIGPCDLDL